METTEVWKRCDECIVPLEVSSHGRVRTLPRRVESRNGIAQTRPGKVLSPWKGNNGYLHIAVKNEERRVKYLVHRLIAMCWVPGDHTLTVNHIDGEKLNNSLSNLEWITKEENTRHQWRTGLVKHPGAKITEDCVRAIRGSTKRASEIAQEFDLCEAAIYMIRKRTRWADVA